MEEISLLNNYERMTENDLMCSTQWIISCRVLFKEKSLLSYDLLQSLENAVMITLKDIPSLSGSIDYENKRILLNQHVINVKYFEHISTEDELLNKPYSKSKFLDELQVSDVMNKGRLFSIMLNKIKTENSSYYLIGFSFSHGIVDGNGMYMVCTKILNILNGIRTELSDDRDLFYKHCYKKINRVNLLRYFEVNDLQPINFNGWLGKIKQFFLKRIMNDSEKKKVRISVDIKDKPDSLSSNEYLSHILMNKYITYYNYTPDMYNLGMIVNARKRLEIPELNSYIGNLSYIITEKNSIETISTERIKNLSKEITKENISNIINIYEASFRENFYIPNLDMRKQTILTNNHSSYNMLIDIPLLKAVRFIPHDISDQILIVRETDEKSKYSIYLGQQYGRKTIENFQ